jgi:hypothetical protein
VLTDGFEPPTFSLSARCSNLLSYMSVAYECVNSVWSCQVHSYASLFPLNGNEETGDREWTQTDSNRQPSACKAGALPLELWALDVGRRDVSWLLSFPTRLPFVYSLPRVYVD